MIRTWKLAKNKQEEIAFSDRSSLDAIARQLPEGYYSTFRTYAGCTRVLGLKAHVQRLPQIDDSLLRWHLNQLLGPYRPHEVRVRVILTMQGQVYISIEPLKLPSSVIYEKGIHVETTEIRRNNPRVKSTAFIGQSDGERRHIAQAGIFEALLVKNGRILEGMTSNFFYIKDGVLQTARRDVLLGVTRRTIVRIARGIGVEVKFNPLKLDQVSTVDEAFITSSSRGIVPVIQIDDVKIGGGKVGLITKQLSAAYEAYVIHKAERL